MTNCDKKDCFEIWAKEDWHSATVQLNSENGKLYIKLDNCTSENSVESDPASNISSLTEQHERDSLANQKRFVRISKTDNNGLGISIKGGRENRMVCL